MRTFLDHYIQALTNCTTHKRRPESGECHTQARHRCSLCAAVDITYAQELTAKNNALTAYWKSARLPGGMEPVIPSPLGRGYRTTSRRKAFRIEGKVHLALMDLEESQTPPFRPLDVVKCLIEPQDHTFIYETAQKLLEKPFSAAASAALNYIFIKGSYSEHTVFFSLSSYSPAVSKAVSRLSKLLMESCDTIDSFYLYIDEGGLPFSLFGDQNDNPGFKRLVGRKEIVQTIMGRQFQYSALSYSVMNLSILEPMMTIAQEMLEPHRADKLIDIFCHYGLFSLGFSERLASAAGIDPSSSAIDAAKANMTHQHVLNCRFVRGEVNETSLKRLVKSSSGNEIAVIHPPKKIHAKVNTKVVIDFLAARKVKKVLHVIRDIDASGEDLNRWKKRGYHPSRIAPLDVTPGLAGIELMVLLEKRSRPI